MRYACYSHGDKSHEVHVTFEPDDDVPRDAIADRYAVEYRDGTVMLRPSNVGTVKAKGGGRYRGSVPADARFPQSGAIDVVPEFNGSSILFRPQTREITPEVAEARRKAILTRKARLEAKREQGWTFDDLKTACDLAREIAGSLNVELRTSEDGRFAIYL